MNLHWRVLGLCPIVLCGVLTATLLFSGCATPEEPVFSSAPVEAAAPTGTSVLGNKLDVFSIGDQVIVTFSDTNLKQHDERIKEDGTITLYLIGSVKAVGKTSGELQKEIQDEYVKQKYFQPGRLTVTVTSPTRVYYVGGEVRNSNRYGYTGAITVTKAIQAAGDFTDYARKTAVELTRAGSNKPIKINVKKALKDPRFDLPVYPGDKIHVPRSWW